MNIKWTKFDTFVIAALFLLLGMLAATGAEAQTNCITTGNFTSCTGPSGTVNCIRTGNFTSCY